jgi:hypothetical protein
MTEEGEASLSAKNSVLTASRRTPTTFADRDTVADDRNRPEDRNNIPRQ